MPGRIEKKALNCLLPDMTLISLGAVGCNLGFQSCQTLDIWKSCPFETFSAGASAAAIVRAAEARDCGSAAIETFA